jgi:hypothetical protein
MRKLYMGCIVGNNENAGGHFFDRGTLRFFNDRASNWDAWEIEGRVFIRNTRHDHGPGTFSHCTLRGQWREVREWGADISMPLKDFHGMRPLRFGRAVEAGKVPNQFPAEG